MKIWRISVNIYNILIKDLVISVNLTREIGTILHPFGDDFDLPIHAGTLESSFPR